MKCFLKVLRLGKMRRCVIFFFGILQSKSFFQTNNQTVYVPNALEGWGRTFTLVLKLRL